MQRLRAFADGHGISLIQPPAIPFAILIIGDVAVIGFAIFEPNLLPIKIDFFH